MSARIELPDMDRPPLPLVELPLPSDAIGTAVCAGCADGGRNRRRDGQALFNALAALGFKATTPAMSIPLEDLRAVTEDDVMRALDRSYIGLPITTPADAVELFNRIIDTLTGEDDAADAGDLQRIGDAAGSGTEQ